MFRQYGRTETFASFSKICACYQLSQLFVVVVNNELVCSLFVGKFFSDFQNHQFYGKRFGGYRESGIDDERNKELGPSFFFAELEIVVKGVLSHPTNNKMY